MIEMGVADNDGISAWYVLLDSLEIRRNAAECTLTQRCSRDVRIEQYDMIVATNLETRRSKPANSNTGIEVGNECVASEFQVFGMHHEPIAGFFLGA